MFTEGHEPPTGIKFISDKRPRVKQLFSNVVDLQIILQSVADDSAEVLNQIKRLVNSELDLKGWEKLAETGLRQVEGTQAHQFITQNLNEMLGIFKRILFATKVQRERAKGHNHKTQRTVKQSGTCADLREQTILRAAVVARDMVPVVSNIIEEVSELGDSQLKYETTRLATLEHYESQDDLYRGVLDQISKKTKRIELDILQPQGIEDSRNYELIGQLLEQLKAQNHLLKEYLTIKDTYIDQNNAEFKVQIQKYNDLVLELRDELQHKQRQLDTVYRDNDELLRMNTGLKKQHKNAWNEAATASSSRVMWQKHKDSSGKRKVLSRQQRKSQPNYTANIYSNGQDSQPLFTNGAISRRIFY